MDKPFVGGTVLLVIFANSVGPDKIATFLWHFIRIITACQCTCLHVSSLHRVNPYSIIKLLGHCLAMPPTGSYHHKLYKRPGHCIPCGDTVTD